MVKQEQDNSPENEWYRAARLAGQTDLFTPRAVLDRVQATGGEAAEAASVQDKTT